MLFIKNLDKYIINKIKPRYLYDIVSQTQIV